MYNVHNIAVKVLYLKISKIIALKTIILIKCIHLQR